MIDLLRARTSLHAFIDPMWQCGRVSRNSIYEEMSKVLGREAHVATMSLEDMKKCADYFLSRDADKWPCHKCKYCIGMRHFLPVCKMKQERKFDVCNLFRDKNSV